MSALRNLAALRRNISNRIRQALEELQESLRNLDRSPAPQRVPVAAGSRQRLTAPQYGNSGSFRMGSCSVRFYSSLAGFSARAGWSLRPQSAGRFGPSLSCRPGHSGPSSCLARTFATYSKFGFNQWKWRPNQVQSFSHRTQFRSKSFSTFYKTPTLTELLKKKVQTHEEHFSAPPPRVLAAVRASIPSAIRLNVSLTERFHDMVMDLARRTSPGGCYVDFALEPTLSIPAATVLHPDILQEMLHSLRRFERHVVALQSDLVRLSELGELPLKYLAAEKVVRVFFPNCDRAELERLLVEKNVCGGVVYEDFSGQCQGIESDGAASSISEFDLLSSCGSPSGTSISSNDILSLDSEDLHHSGDIVHVEPIATSCHVDIVEDWAY